MDSDFATSGFSDALEILGAAGIVIPRAFDWLRITLVIGFIIVEVIAGPFALGALSDTYP